MNCREFEPLIALYAGRDLEDTAALEAHLAECRDCRKLLQELQTNVTALRESGLEAVDAALLTSVRARVMEDVGVRRRMLWLWVAALAAGTILLALAWHRPDSPPSPMAVAQPPKAVDVHVDEARPLPPPRRRLARRRTTPKREPLVVKMLTDDPDIVIVWLVDQRGD